ncbi:MAG: sigma-70 family RNA polymerase sigma factor [Solirubrobacterales bacterium]
MRSESAVAGVAPSGSASGPAEARRRAAEALVTSHDAVFRRTARRYSICADDAEDAYQRSLEILLTKAPPIEGDSLVRWMQTVTKREALAVRRQRERLLSAPRPAAGEEYRDPLDEIAAEAAGPGERAASRERVARSGEALRALKPQELRALTLKAQGYSYEEIGEITGWTHTKINRCMAEGRKRFLEVFAEIEHGRRCERLTAALSALADGEAPSGAGAEELELHLRACGSCRAKLRAFRAIPGRVLELAPLPAADQATGGAMHQWMGEKLTAATEKVREAGYSLLVRAPAGESATPLAASGGTRGAGMAALGKLLAVCGATAAGGAACVATGVVDSGAVGIGAEPEKPAPIGRPVETPIEQPAAEPDPAQSPAPAPASAEQPAKPESPEPPPPTPAQQSSQQFGIESSAPSDGSTGSGSSSGGGEFGGPSGGGGGGGGGSGGGGFGFENG